MGEGRIRAILMAKRAQIQLDPGGGALANG